MKRNCEACKYYVTSEDSKTKSCPRWACKYDESMTREEAKQILEINKPVIKRTSISARRYVEAFNMAISALSENKGGWIPVSERLPEEDVAVLIWCPERKNIYCAYLEQNQWWIFGAYFQKVPLEVVAWQPLPEPYKAESEDK